MISDVLFAAVCDIEQYQRNSDCYDELEDEIGNVTGAMKELLRRLDAVLECDELALPLDVQNRISQCVVDWQMNHDERLFDFHVWNFEGYWICERLERGSDRWEAVFPYDEHDDESWLDQFIHDAQDNPVQNRIHDEHRPAFRTFRGAILREIDSILAAHATKGVAA